MNDLLIPKKARVITKQGSFTKRGKGYYKTGHVIQNGEVIAKHKVRKYLTDKTGRHGDIFMMHLRVFCACGGVKSGPLMPFTEGNSNNFLVFH